MSTTCLRGLRAPVGLAALLSLLAPAPAAAQTAPPPPASPAPAGLEDPAATAPTAPAAATAPAAPAAPAAPEATAAAATAVPAAPAPAPGGGSFTARVQGERPMTAASAMTVRDQDLRLRPIQRMSDLLRVTPGLITAQHAGGGKANQYFLRGFDADHGTDLSLTIDGVPINMVSHAHGQGYSDTNFIIPELVERIEVYKGPYFFEWGDFATAGAVNMVTRRNFNENLVSISGGSFNTVRGLAVASPTFSSVPGLRPMIVAEFTHTDGPFQNPESFNKFNLFSKLSYDFSPQSTISLAVSSYAGDWRGSGQIPSREVDAGRLDFFGYVDPTEGGNSARHNVYLSYQIKPDSKSELTAMAYYTRYTLKLYSNFTLFSRDPVNGDGIEQGDERNITGLRAQYRRRIDWRWLSFTTSLGINARLDDIHNSLYYQRERERLENVVDHGIRETSLGAYLKEEIAFSKWVRLIGGARADFFVFDVTDNHEDTGTTGTRTSGVVGAARISPKATLVVSPHLTTDIFFNFGYGFHSNDARGVVRGVDPVTPLTPAIGYEVGARTRLFDRLDLAASFWGLDLESELVWVGDEGTTEASGPSRRLGFEFEGRMRILSWLFADLDITVNDAKFTQNAGNANSVALAPRFTLAGGVSALTPFGLRGSVRVTGITDRPATEDGFLTAQGWFVFDAFVGYRWRMFEAGLSVENLTNRQYKLAQFATVSRLRTEAPTTAPPPPGACPQGTRVATSDNGNFAGCEDVNFTPGFPINVQARGTFYF